MPVDLTKTDTYPAYNIPDADVETCLRVLRTLRLVCVTGPTFHPRAALILAHAYRETMKLMRLCDDEDTIVLSQNPKEQADAGSEQAKTERPGPEGGSPDPDLAAG